MVLLELQKVGVSYPTPDGVAHALRGVSLSLEAGRTLGLAGESGCGKTTLALAVLRLLPRTAHLSGQILLDGEDVATMSWGRLRAVRWSAASVVFQGATQALNPVRRVCAQVAEPIRRHTPGLARAEIRRRVVALLDRVGIPVRRADAYPHQLSGGQRQRVLIAMALACQPRLVIADEPTTGLDVVAQAQLLVLLAELVAERGVGLVVISHDLSVLAASCERLAVMYAGRVVESGPAPGVLRAPAHPYTAALVEAFPTVGDPAARRRPRPLAGDPPDPANLPAGCAFHPRCPVALPACAARDVGLRPVRENQRAACALVGASG